MDSKQTKSIKTELEASKARLRSISGNRAWSNASSTPSQAKIQFLEASERLETMGTKIITNTVISQLETWARWQPWQATCAAVAAGLLAGRMRQNDVVFLNTLLQLLSNAAHGDD